MTPSPPETADYVERIAALVRAGRLDEAEDLVAEAGALRPDLPELWAHRAEIAMQRSAWETASLLWGLTRERFPGEIAAYVRGVTALARSGLLGEAEFVAATARIRFPGSLWVAHCHADCAGWRLDWREAVERWAAIRAAFPDDPAGYSRGVEALRGAGALKAADDLALEGASRFSGDAGLCQMAMLACLRSGDMEGAISRASALRSAHPQDPAAWIAEAAALRAAGRLGDAWSLLAGAPEPVRTESRIQVEQLAVGIEAGRYEEAEALWEEIAAVGGALLPERLFDLTWRLYIRDPKARSASRFLAFVLGEPDRDRPGWLPVIAIAVSGLFADPARLERLKADLMCLAAAPSATHGAQLPLVRAMIDETFDAAALRALIGRYVDTPRRNLLFMLFSPHGKDRAGLDPRHETSVEVLREIVLALIERLARDASSVGEDETYTLLVLAYILFRDGFHRLILVLRELTAPGSPSRASLRAKWKSAYPTLEAICSLTRGDSTDWPAVPPAVRTQRRLRIALCVSGQLRGFRHGRASWDRLGLSAHELITVVHTWADVGRRYPDPSFTARIFSGRFLEAYLTAARTLDIDALTRRYPGFFAHFRSPDIVARQTLSEFYATQHVVVEDDRDETFGAYTNPMKMYYKIQACHDLAMSLGVEFDLVIRLRPDKFIHDCGEIDWLDLARRSSAERRIFADMPPTTSPPGFFEVGDQFAVGAMEPMHAYARAWSSTRETARGGPFGMPKGYHGHVNLAVSTLHQGVLVERMPQVVFGRELDPERPSARKIVALLTADVEQRSRDLVDDALLTAAEADLSA